MIHTISHQLSELQMEELSRANGLSEQEQILSNIAQGAYAKWIYPNLPREKDFGHLFCCMEATWEDDWIFLDFVYAWNRSPLVDVGELLHQPMPSYVGNVMRQGCIDPKTPRLFMPGKNVPAVKTTIMTFERYDCPLKREVGGLWLRTH